MNTSERVIYVNELILGSQLNRLYFDHERQEKEKGMIEDKVWEVLKEDLTLATIYCNKRGTFLLREIVKFESVNLFNAVLDNIDSDSIKTVLNHEYDPQASLLGFAFRSYSKHATQNLAFQDEQGLINAKFIFEKLCEYGAQLFENEYEFILDSIEKANEPKLNSLWEYYLIYKEKNHLDTLFSNVEKSESSVKKQIHLMRDSNNAPQHLQEKNTKKGKL